MPGRHYDLICDQMDDRVFMLVKHYKMYYSIRFRQLQTLPIGRNMKNVVELK